MVFLVDFFCVLGWIDGYNLDSIEISFGDG